MIHADNYHQGVDLLNAAKGFWIYGLSTASFIRITKSQAKKALSYVHEYEDEFGTKRVRLDKDSHLIIEI